MGSNFFGSNNGFERLSEKEMVASLRIVRDNAGKKLGPNQAHFPPNP